MGCGQSNTFDEIKGNEQLKVPRNTLVADEIERLYNLNLGSLLNLENYTLLSRFLNKPLVKKYFDKFSRTGQIDESSHSEFSGIFNLIKEDIDDLFNIYDITYQVPTKNFEVDCTTYKLKCQCTNAKDLDLYMPLFFYEFVIYPKSFIAKSKIQSIVFINHLDFTTEKYSQYRAGCPEYNETQSLYFCTKERSFNYVRTVIHHEYFHFVDWIHDETFEDSIWRSYNSKDFEYGQGGAMERVWKPLDPKVKGFINFYATTGIEEDKAEIYQYLISNPSDALKNPDEIIQTKVRYILQFLKDFDEEGFGNKEQNFISDLVDFRKQYVY